MDDEDHNEEYEPADVGTDAPADTALVEEKTHADGADHLGEPVNKVVQRASTDVEDCAVVVIEFWFRDTSALV